MDMNAQGCLHTEAAYIQQAMRYGQSGAQVYSGRLAGRIGLPRCRRVKALVSLALAPAFLYLSAPPAKCCFFSLRVGLLGSRYR